MDSIFNFLFRINFRRNFFNFNIDKSRLSYIGSKTSLNGVSQVEDKLLNISTEDENVCIRYLLEIMMEHGIITEEEYHTVLYKFD